MQQVAKHIQFPAAVNLASTNTHGLWYVFLATRMQHFKGCSETFTIHYCFILNTSFNKASNSHRYWSTVHENQPISGNDQHNASSNGDSKAIHPRIGLLRRSSTLTMTPWCLQFWSRRQPGTFITTSTTYTHNQDKTTVPSRRITTKSPINQYPQYTTHVLSDVTVMYQLGEHAKQVNIRHIVLSLSTSIITRDLWIPHITYKRQF